MDNFALEPLQIHAARQELLACNARTALCGLTLTETDVEQLAQAHVDALRSTGRVEFGGGALQKLVYAFCDSPYLTQENYAQTLSELQEIFYCFKNESGERLSDDELIGAMKEVFDGRAQGSLEYLAGTSPEELCRRARSGWF